MATKVTKDSTLRFLPSVVPKGYSKGEQKMKLIQSELNTNNIARRIVRACVCAATGMLLTISGAVWAGACDYVDDMSAKVGAGVAGTGAVAGVALKAASVSAVAHSSGGAIVTVASSGYVSGTLGAVGAFTAILTAPATIIAGSIAIVATGGALAYCHYTKVP
jgi:hypothetical protein